MNSKLLCTCMELQFTLWVCTIGPILLKAQTKTELGKQGLGPLRDKSHHHHDHDHHSSITIKLLHRLNNSKFHPSTTRFPKSGHASPARVVWQRINMMWPHSFRTTPTCAPACRVTESGRVQWQISQSINQIRFYGSVLRIAVISGWRTCLLLL